MSERNRRPFPFMSDHEWVDDCEASCPNKHLGMCGKPLGRHCRKCGIPLWMAQSRSQDIDVEACSIREIGRCRGCQALCGIPVESPEGSSLCIRCLYPDAPIFQSASEMLKAMQDINAGMMPDLPGTTTDPKKQGPS
jgi:hypothetical protein